VRRLAREVGVDLAKVRGSGPGGRILREDVLAASRARLEQRAIVSTPPPTTGDTSAASSDLYGPYGEVRRAAMSKVRRATAEQMARAWATIPHVTHFDETDITDLDRQRRALAPDVEAAGGSLTMTAILLKITALALRRFPQFAASIDMERQEVIYKEYVHIGVAVDTERGLIVPVLRDADRKSLVDIAIELHSLAARARSGKLALEEMRGAVFTITNLGGIGGVGFTPIINPPEVAILAVSRATVRPVMRSGVWEPRLILPFSLSYDHRIIDGADAARFCRWIAQTIETPLKLLLEQADV
jgi:pyruvate dehydrogenase E2 component (dihydrolipoamide acetyltransferase)